MRLISSTILITALIGCGVSDDTLIKDFEPDDVQRFCDEISGDVREVVCNYEGVTASFEIGYAYDDCLDTYEPTRFTECDLTAGDVRACEDALGALSDEDFCALDTGYPEACADVVACLFIAS